jgi:hypothetical protein
MTQQTDRGLIQRLTGALDELRDLIPAIKDGSYEPDSFTLQPLESAIQDVSIALAQPETEGVPDAEALMAAWDSAISKPRMGRLAEYRTWLAYALSLVWAVNKVQTQPETEGPTDEQWDAIKERLWDKYETVGYLGERFIYQGDFDTALDVARKDLTRWDRPTIKPVPVAERPWEREGWCDAEGRCWLHRPAEIPCRLANGTLYRWVLDMPCRDEEEPVHDTHSLPHHALPIPADQ